MHLKLSRGRQIASICLVIIFFGILGADLVKLQIFEQKEYEAIVSNVSERTAPITAARGEIVDCNGKKLVYNQQSYSIVFDATYFPSKSDQQNRNRIVSALIRLLESNKLEWIDNLPLEFDAEGKISYKADSDYLIKLLRSRDYLNLNDYATAENCLNALIEKYDLQKYGKREVRKISSVFFEMEHKYFSPSAPYTFAENIPAEIIALIKENSDFYLGVDVEVVPERSYTDGSLAPHLLGLTGVINAEEYAEKKELGYSQNDIIGRSGLELAAEEYLKGKDGVKTIYTDSEGNRTTEVTQEPEQGNTVVLTINSGLQKVTQDSLAQACVVNNTKFSAIVPSAGAAVVLSCKDSSVLACASYPTYDLSSYSEDAEALNKASGSPLWNRALMSTYACGSTAKPSVAIAALEEGIIDEDTTFECHGSYNYLGQIFKCEQGHARSNVDVVHAIDESCNTFFMVVGDLLGIEKMNEYREMFGLGAKTGCELNEAVGVLDSPEYRASRGQDWLPGYVVQSAIGQAGNLWTPIQLANYVNTIANGGTRYKCHFIKSVKSADYSKTVYEAKTEVVCETGISQKAINLVKEGMLEVGTTGYCAPYFLGLPVQVACKTGTSQEIRRVNGISYKINNGFLIAFAPYENPEIAIAVVGEGLISGKYLATVVADIVEYYCGMRESADKIQPSQELIP